MMLSKKLFNMASNGKILPSSKEREFYYPKRKQVILTVGHRLLIRFILLYNTTDQKRFMIPLKYLNEMIFRELLKLSEEKFGFQSNGLITLPFDASVLEYIILLLESRARKDLEKALLMSVVTRCSTSLSVFNKEQIKQHSLVCGY